MAKLFLQMYGFMFIFLILPLSWASLLRDVELQHHVLTTTRQSSLLDCSAACLVDTCCLSFNFFQPTLECQLNSRTKEQYPFDFVPKKGSFYRNKDDITPSVAGICGTNACFSSEGCRHVYERNEKECYLRDTNVTEPAALENTVMTHNCDDAMDVLPCSGSYKLTAPEVNNVTVYCDMATPPGGWLVFQRRMDGSVDFYRNWTDYKTGFGDVTREFWLGNEIIHQITNRATYELRVDLEDFEGNTSYAVYSSFSLDSEAKNYTLHLGTYSGNAGNSLGSHDKHAFSTQDRDHDLLSYNCAEVYGGAWWYLDCHNSNLNGLYLRGPMDSFADGVVWNLWRGDAMSHHDNRSFSTLDRDHDNLSENCAQEFHGAWWYNACHNSNLNGLYLHGPTGSFADGVVWSLWKGFYYSLKKTEMKIRPRVDDYPWQFK